MKTAVRIILVLFVLASVAYLVFDRSETAVATETAAADQTPQDSIGDQVGDQVLVYYFHGDVRCPTCIKIEALSTKAIESGFAGEIADGRLVWQAVNVDQPENAHFVDDYELYTKSLIVVKKHNGDQTEWKNLPQIWELVNDDAAFIKYVDDEVKAYVGDA